MKGNSEFSRSATPASLRDGVDTLAANLAPASFAMVMATGIVSLAAHMMGMPRIAIALLWLNICLYPALAALTVLRAVRFSRQFLDDLRNHQRAPGFFTIVAASCVLGSQFVLLREDYQTAVALWGIGLALWLLLTYGIFLALSVQEAKPPLERGINGAWLLAVVAPQSVAVLSTLLAAHGAEPYKSALDFLALSLHLWGGMLYLWLIVLIFYRFAFLRLAPEDMVPSYWINMGATAISALAGSLLVSRAADAAYLQALLPFLKGFTLFYWVTGTWWVPLLVALGIWRHLYKAVPLRYDPLHWSVVFPLGMYAACTWHMTRALELPFLESIPRFFLYLALLAWLAAFSGLVHALSKAAKR